MCQLLVPNGVLVGCTPQALSLQSEASRHGVSTACSSTYLIGQLIPLEAWEVLQAPQIMPMR